MPTPTLTRLPAGFDTEELPPPPPPPTRARDVAARAHGFAKPAIVGAIGLGACALVSMRDPNQAGSYGVCPFLAVTGMDCPGCGLTRGAHALFTGEPAEMLDHNILAPFIFAFIVVAYLNWAARSVGFKVRSIRVPRWGMITAGIVLVVFGVARNLPGPLSFLDSIAS